MNDAYGAIQILQIRVTVFYGLSCESEENGSKLYSVKFYSMPINFTFKNCVFFILHILQPIPEKRLHIISDTLFHLGMSINKW